MFFELGVGLMSLVVKKSEMLRQSVSEGETLYIVPGESHGFDSLTLALSETEPGSGAPAHRHQCEEAHVLIEGELTYVVDGQTFVARGPCVVRIPAETEHSFVNTGPGKVTVVGVVPRSREADIDVS